MSGTKLMALEANFPLHFKNFLIESLDGRNQARNYGEEKSFNFFCQTLCHVIPFAVDQDSHAESKINDVTFQYTTERIINSIAPLSGETKPVVMEKYRVDYQDNPLFIAKYGSS